MESSSRDQLIDDVARSLTSVEAAPDLAERVLARLDRRRPWLPSAPLAGAAALVLLLTGGLFGVRWMASPDVPQPDPVAAVIADPAAVLGAQEHANVATTLAGPPPGDAAARPAAPLPTGLTLAEAAWLARRIPALETPEAIEIEGIQPASVEIPLLEVKPLALAPLTLTPLETTGGG